MKMPKWLKKLEEDYNSEDTEPCDTYMEDCLSCYYRELCLYWQKQNPYSDYNYKKEKKD